MWATSSQSLYVVSILRTYFLFLFFTAAFLFVLALTLSLTFSTFMFLLLSHLLRFIYFCRFLVTFLILSSFSPIYLFQLIPSFLSLTMLYYIPTLEISSISTLSLSLSVSRFPCISFSLCLFVDVGDEEEAGPLCRFQNSRERCKFLAPSISVSVPEDEPYYSDEEYYDHPLFSPEWTLSGSRPSGQAAAFSQIEGEPSMVPLHHPPPFSSFLSLSFLPPMLFCHVYPNLGLSIFSLYFSCLFLLFATLPSVFCLLCCARSVCGAFLIHGVPFLLSLCIFWDISF